MSVLFSPALAADDPFLWLEEVEGERALEWVRAQNERTGETLASGEDFRQLRDRLKAIFDSDDRIPYVAVLDGLYYNFWRDAEHPRGVWRRTTPASYRTDEPDWEVILDLDALAEKEGKNWVWHGATCLRPSFERCMVALSPGGSDADVKREFDLRTASFVEGGFELPEAKSEVSWIDRDHLYVMTDMGEGSLTTSGYPRTARLWTRGTPLSEAPVVFEGEREDVAAGVDHDATVGYERDFAYRSPTFFTNLLFELDPKRGPVPVPKPDDVYARVFRDRIYFHLRKDWEHGGFVHPAGSLLVADYKKWMKGKGRLETLFTPDEHTSLEDWGFTDHHVWLNLLRDVKSEILVLTPGKKGWTREPLEGAPELGNLIFRPVDPDKSDDYFLIVTDYLTPTYLAYGTLGGGPPERLKQLPHVFDAEGLVVEQHFATSKDGTRVPYFQIGPADLPLDGSTPTLLYGYGGFEVSLTPSYIGHVGAGWLEKGGVYVVANIRGGGEYGPRWHQAALKEKRHRAYEDFVAVADDLVRRKVTSPERLGAMGGSNGGLLMGNMYTLYPERFGAIVCQVPLLDMKRYTKLLAGASWMGEYGDPDDPEQWAFIKTFSPYHNIDPEADYPPILFTTSTRDDRVHPGHARKMAAKLLELGKDVTYYENIEGGHGGAADNAQAAHMRALAYTFLAKRLGLVEPVDEGSD